MPSTVSRVRSRPRASFSASFSQAALSDLWADIAPPCTPAKAGVQSYTNNGAGAPPGPRPAPGYNLARSARAADEVGDIGLELGERLGPQVRHVAGLVIMILDVAPERRRHRQMPHLHLALEIGRRDVEIAAVHHHLHVRVLHHRG